LGSLDKNFCIQKIDSAIELVDRLLDGDHPHDDSKTALEKLKGVYVNDRDLLRSLDESVKTDTILEHCRRANVNLVRLKTFVGFLLRSTNIRNAFEFYFPIRLLATELLGKPAPVVLGSEWEFSPYTYPAALDELPDLIFIGIPASECSNPLILPLAGHELGHVVWRRQGVQAEADPNIRSCVLDRYKANWDDFKKLFNPDAGVTSDMLETDLFLLNIWSKSYALARRQLEELFCDAIGVYVFGQSFLHSFRYLLSPNLGKLRTLHYPRIQTRARYMLQYARSLGMGEYEGFIEAFSDTDPRLGDREKFVVKIADDVVDVLQKDLAALVQKFKGGAQNFSDGAEEQKRALKLIGSLVPPAKITSISAVVNAAWDIRLNLEKWDVLSHLEDRFEQDIAKQKLLSDLVLKTFEIYEYLKRTEKHAA
jgi:hypothetical protein